MVAYSLRMRGWVFAGWVVVGALGAVTSIAILSIGIFVFPFFVLAGASVARRTRYPLDALGLVADIGSPVNAMCRPGGPSLAELTATGVARITFGSSLHQRATEELTLVARALHAEA